MTGRIHSIETMGLHEGPGVRFTVFMQGCPLRCVYCHNPDTWSISDGTDITVEALFKKLLRYRSYFLRSGGITFTGGEPLLQKDFITEVFKLCRAHGIHTTLDTSGAGSGSYIELLKNTDLVLLDLKGATPDEFALMTTKDHSIVLPFHHALKNSSSRIWIRHVTVPGFSDSPEHLEKIAALARTFPNLDKVEYLPYHTLGVEKYAALGLSYCLADFTLPLFR